MGTKLYNIRGFTIVEILIAMAILGILATIVGFAYNNVQYRAKLSSAQSDMATLGKSAKVFMGQTERSPTTAADFLEILNESGLYDETHGADPSKSFAVCSSDTGFAFVVWEPIVEAYKKGDILYLFSDDDGQEVYTLTNSSLSSFPNQSDKVCDQVLAGHTYNDWSYNL